MSAILLKLVKPIIGFVLKQPLWRVILAAFVGTVLWASLSWGLGEHHRRVDADAKAAQLIILNNDAQARYAKLEQEKGTLEELLAAKKKLGGKLVAGVEIRVKPETVYVPIDTAPTTIKDSTRYATRTDSTEGYHVTVKAEAPPFPSPLKLGYTITTPEFRPQVGFVKKNNDYYAIVSYQGKQFTTEDAFFSEKKDFPFSVWGGIDVMGAPRDSADTIQPSVYLGLKYKNPDSESMLKAGIGKTPYVGVSFEKKFF